MNKRLVSRAVNGDEDAANVLRQLGIDALKHQAGLIPPETTATFVYEIPMGAEAVNGLENLMLMRRASRLSFSDYEESAEYFSQIFLNPPMPMMPLARLNKSLYEISRWINGRAWIAGSAALWCVDADANWCYGDVDIFCKSNEYAEMLCAELDEVDGNCFQENEHSTKYGDHPFPESFAREKDTLSIIAPGEQDWSTVENLLLGFDLSICAVALASPSEAYAYSPSDVSRQAIRVIKMSYPRKTLQRILKYQARGYFLLREGFDSLAESEKLDEEFDMLGEAASFAKAANLQNFVACYRTAVYERDYGYDEGDYGYEDSEDEDDYEYS
jgi:hypothetical protein